MSEQRIQELVTNITEARTTYHNGEATVSDDIYDAWVGELSELDSSNTILNSVGAKPTSEWINVKHDVIAGSLKKVNTPEEMTKWINDNCPGENVVLSEKLDGLSLLCKYNNGLLYEAVLRGDSVMGENILANAVRMKGVKINLLDKKFTGTLRGEIIVKRSDFKKYFVGKANPRNAAAGTCRRLDGSNCEHLNVLFYKVFGEGSIELKTEWDAFMYLSNNLGLQIPNVTLLHSDGNIAEGINKIWEEYQETTRDQLDYDIDGLVITISDIQKQEDLGYSGKYPNSATAYKFKGELRESKIVNIIPQTGKSGNVTPVAIVEPVILMGAKVERASLYNMGYVQRLGLDIGASVLVVRRNDVIPAVDCVTKSTGTIFQPFTNCPSCGAVLEEKGEYLICPNSLDCPAQVNGRIINWIKVLSVMEWGPALIDRLVEAGKINSIIDLYKLTVDDLASLERMGEKSAQKAYDELWDKNNLPLDVFLGGLPITGIGVSSFSSIMAAGYDTIDKILSMSLSELISVPKVGQVKGEIIFKGLKNNANLIKQLIDLGIKPLEKIVGKFTGKSFQFTGTMKHKRAELEGLVKSNGGNLGSGKTLTYLVIDDINSTTSKAVAARKYGTKLLSEQEFMDLLDK